MTLRLRSQLDIIILQSGMMLGGQLRQLMIQIISTDGVSEYQ